MNKFLIVQSVKNLADKFVEMGMFDTISEVVGNPTILRTYKGAYASINRGDDLIPHIPSSQMFFNTLFKVLKRTYEWRTDPFWIDFMEDLVRVYPPERKGYTVLGGSYLLYRGEDDFFPWVVSTSDHPNKSATLLDRTIGEKVFNEGVDIDYLVEKYGDIDPHLMAGRIEYDRYQENYCWGGDD